MGPEFDQRRAAGATKIKRRSEVNEMTKTRERPAEPIIRPFIGISYRVEEAARMIGISRTTLWERIKEGRIPVKKEGGSTLVTHRDLEAYIESLPYDDRKAAH